MTKQEIAGKAADDIRSMFDIGDPTSFLASKNKGPEPKAVPIEDVPKNSKFEDPGLKPKDKIEYWIEKRIKRALDEYAPQMEAAEELANDILIRAKPTDYHTWSLVWQRLQTLALIVKPEDSDV